MVIKLESTFINGFYTGVDNYMSINSEKITESIELKVNEIIKTKYSKNNPEVNITSVNNFLRGYIIGFKETKEFLKKYYSIE